MARENIDAKTCPIWTVYQNSRKFLVSLPSQKKFDDSGKAITSKFWHKVYLLDWSTVEPKELFLPDEMLLPNDDPYGGGDPFMFYSQDFGLTMVETTMGAVLERGLQELERTDSNKFYHDGNITEPGLRKYQNCVYSKCLVNV